MCVYGSVSARPSVRACVVCVVCACVCACARGELTRACACSASDNAVACWGVYWSGASFRIGSVDFEAPGCELVHTSSDSSNSLTSSQCVCVFARRRRRLSHLVAASTRVSISVHWPLSSDIVVSRSRRVPPPSRPTGRAPPSLRTHPNGFARSDNISSSQNSPSSRCCLSAIRWPISCRFAAIIFWVAHRSRCFTSRYTQHKHTHRKQPTYKRCN